MNSQGASGSAGLTVKCIRLTGGPHKQKMLTNAPTTKVTATEAKEFIKDLKEVDAQVNRFFVRGRSK